MTRIARPRLGSSQLALLSPLVLLAAALGCSSSNAEQRDPQYTLVRPPEETATRGGIPSDKQAEIQLVLQNREPSALKCYQDVLSETHDRSFQGAVKVLITLQPSGQASDVKVTNSTLKSPRVEECLTNKIQTFEFPEIPAQGQVEYEYRFRPAY